MVASQIQRTIFLCVVGVASISFADEVGQGSRPFADQLEAKAPFPDQTSLSRKAIKGHGTLPGEWPADAALPSRVRRDVNPPTFSSASYTVTLADKTPVQKRIYTVSATDVDLQGSLVYTMQSNNFFRIDKYSGDIRVIKDLRTDTSLDASYVLRVIAFDSAQPSADATATLTIAIARNPNAPVFFQESYTVTISKLISVGSVILTMSATDTDKDNITFSIVSSSPLNAIDFFSIGSDKPAVEVIRSLSIIPATEVNLTVRATDNGVPSRSAETLVTILIQDDLHAPRWSATNYEATVMETLSVGSSVVQVLASDDDTEEPYGDIQYSLNGKGSDYFTIKKSGIILLSKSLDEDSLDPDVYTLLVRARNEDQVVVYSATVTIQILRNQHPPVIQNLPGSLVISSSVGAGVRIFMVTVKDADSVAEYSIVNFTLAGDSLVTSLFNISETSGIIQTKRSLAEDTSTEYRLLVLARDGGVPSLVTTGTLTVSVNRGSLAEPNKDDKTEVIIGVVSGVVAFILLVVAVVLIYRRLRRNKRHERPTSPRDSHIDKGTNHQQPQPLLHTPPSSGTPCTSDTRPSPAAEAKEEEPGEHIYVGIVDAPLPEQKGDTLASSSRADAAGENVYMTPGDAALVTPTPVTQSKENSTL